MGQVVIWTVWFLTLLPVMVGQLPPPPEQGDQETAQTPGLIVAQRMQNLGVVLEGDKVPVSWLIENRGEKALVIKQTKSDCGCAVVKLTEKQKTLPPGGTLKLTAEFDSTRRRGKQKKSITIYTNDPVEPKVKLEFVAQIRHLYEMDPSGVINLRAVQRGTPAERTLEIVPGKGRKVVQLLGVEFKDDVPLACRAEQFDGPAGTGQRLHFTVAEHAAMGTLTAKGTLKLKVDDVERTRAVTVRAAVVGDLTFLPRVLDATGQVARPGRRLGPVTIRSPDKIPFKIVEATAGPLLEVTFEPQGKGSGPTKYDVYATVRADAPAGPFAAMLEVRTDSLDQPLVCVPVFGMVAPLVDVEPPLVLLRQDGTPVGTKRRVKIQASPQDILDIHEITCDLQAVVAEVDRAASARYKHLRFLNVVLAGDLPAGTHETVLRLTTSLHGAEHLEIPVIIEVPD